MTELEIIRAEGKVAEANEIRDALASAHGNVARAARILTAIRNARTPEDVEITRQAFYRLMDKHGITRPKKAQP